MTSVLGIRALLALSIDGGAKRTWEEHMSADIEFLLDTQLIIDCHGRIELEELIP